MADHKQLDKAEPLLSREHFETLVSGSGISVEVVNARKYRTITEPKQLRDLGFNRQQSLQVPGLLIPVHCTDGSNGIAVYRPDIPRTVETKKRNSDGSFKTHVIKYEMPAGMAMRLDCPPLTCIKDRKVETRRLLLDPSVPLWITEGQKKADALASHGLCAVALLGVWNFKGRNQYGGITWLADWDWVALNNGRDVRIVFDSDVMTKPEVRFALDRLTTHIQNKKGHVAAVHLPMDRGEKVGVDDYLLTHTVEDLEGLIEAPRPKIKAAAPTVELLEDEPLSMRRPICLLNGRAYVAIWPMVRVTVTETMDKEGNIIKLETPDSIRERRCLVMRDDGMIFNTNPEQDDTGFETPTDIIFKLNTIPEEKHLWSTRAIKAFREGKRPDPNNVFTRIIQIIDYYIDFDKSLADQHTMAEMLSCYIIATWFLDAFQVIGYLWPNGEFGSGKSELLNAVCQMAFLGEMIMPQSTIATIRDAADYGGTLAFDEVEKLQQDKTKADLVAILLAGNRRGATLAAKEPGANGAWETRRFNCFCARLFAATRLPDGALATRSIIIPLIRSIDEQKPNRMVTAVETWPHPRQALIDDLWALSLTHLASMKEYDEQVATKSKLKGRQLEPWRAILAIAAWLDTQGVSGLWNRIHALSVSYQGESQELDSTSMTKLVIRALDEVFAEREVVMFCEVSGGGDTRSVKTSQITDLAKQIVKDDELPIDEEWVTDKRIGWVLKRLRFTHGREAGTGRAKWQIRRVDVERYKLAFGVSIPPETSQTSQTSHPESNLRMFPPTERESFEV